MEWTETVIATDRMPVPALTYGDGRPLVCLHGFPDHPATFGPLASALAPRGWRVIAPFLRGYHPDVRPDEDYYDIATLVADAAALCQTVGASGPVPVVGHDWGATIVYGLAAAFPEHLSSGVAMAVPPLHALTRFLGDPGQLQRSFYMWFFQLRDLPELVLGAGPELIDFLWRTWSPGLTEVPHREAVHETFADHATAVAAISYYRSMFDRRLRDPALAELRPHLARDPVSPVLVLGGADDGCISADLLSAGTWDLPEWCSTKLLEGCGHFLHLERTETVAELIHEWLGR